MLFYYLPSRWSIYEIWTIKRTQRDCIYYIYTILYYDGATAYTYFDVQEEPVGPPEASFTFSPASPEVDEPVTFDASTSTDYNGQIVYYAWNFGDGTQGGGEINTHTYTSAGNYTVSLTVRDNDGLIDGITKTITVRPKGEAPEASFTYTPTTPQMNTPVTFNAGASTDPDGNIVSYAWNFGDQTTGLGVTTTHTSSSVGTYTVTSSVGTYTVTLTVTDNDGQTDSITHTITIVEPQPQPPNAAFTSQHRPRRQHCKLRLELRRPNHRFRGHHNPHLRIRRHLHRHANSHRQQWPNRHSHTNHNRSRTTTRSIIHISIRKSRSQPSRNL